MNISAIVTGYNNAESLIDILPLILEYPFNEIVLAVGGADNTLQIVSSIIDHRVKVIFEDERIGKISALKRAIGQVSCDAAFLICADTTFTHRNLNDLLEHLTPEIGVVVPSVEPSNQVSFATNVASQFWFVRNAHLHELDRLGKPLHGGEMLLVRYELLQNLPEVINDDAFICLKGIELGHGVRFASDVVIHNRVPEHLVNLLMQRERVNFGHTELKNLSMNPSVISRSFFNNPAFFVRVMVTILQKRKMSFVYLPFAVALEILSIMLSKRDKKNKRNFMIWPMVD